MELFAFILRTTAPIMRGVHAVRELRAARFAIRAKYDAHYDDSASRGVLMEVPIFSIARKPPPRMTFSFEK